MNSNSNNCNEYLFWKVIHNKYLFNKIIYHIQNEEWVKYDDHSQLHINNRLKFKDIHSLNWMLKNKQYQLLNNKLDNNDYISINRDSITTLFRQLSTINNNNNNNKLKKKYYNYKSDEDKEDDDDDDDDDESEDDRYSDSSDEEELKIQYDKPQLVVVLKEIIIKLLSKRRRRIEFEIIDLTLEAVKCNSLEGLRILINEPYSIPIYPSTLEYAIQYSHPSIVEEIFNSNSMNNEIFENVINESLVLATNNFKFETEMVECVLSNLKLRTTEKEEEEEEEQPRKKFKSSPSLQITKITFPKFISIKSNKAKKIIFENDLICLKTNISKLSDLKNFKVLEFSYDDLLYTLKYYGYYENYCSSSQITTTTTTESTSSLKELQALFIINVYNDNDIPYSTYDPYLYIGFYKQYIIKYKETIDECHYHEEEEEEGEEEESDSIIFQNDQDKLKFKQFKRIIELFDFKVCLKDIPVWNQLIFDLLILVITPFNGYYQKIIVNDWSTVEWILDIDNSKSILNRFKDYFTCIKFGTLELANHINNNKHILKHYLFNGNDDHLLRIIRKSYSNTWYEAIEQFDFNRINYLESLNIGIEELEFNVTLPTLSINQTIELVNNFNEIGFIDEKKRHGAYYKYQLLFTQIINGFSNQSSSGSGDNNNQMELLFSNIKLNIKNYNISSILYNQMIDMNLKMVELLLNSSYFDDNQYKAYLINHERLTFKFSGKVYYYKEKKGATRIEIIEIIKKAIKRISPPQQQPSNKESISQMVNYFYERLISIKGITMNEVYQVYQLIQHHSITVNHDFYHTFYYLHIKDIKYTFYLTSSYYYTKLIFDGRGKAYYYNCFKDEDEEDDDYLVYLEDYLKPDEFTFEVINSLPFDQVLEMIINALSPLMDRFKLSNSNSYFQREFSFQLNSDLKYYLIIRRVDLFFKKLQQIKSIADKENLDYSNNSNWSFPRISILDDSPTTTLLSNSTLFNSNSKYDDDEGILIKPPFIPVKFIENYKNYEFQPIELALNAFRLSDQVVKFICKSLNLDEIIKVLIFNYYQTSFQIQLLHYSIIYQRFDIIRMILDNFKISELSFLNLKYRILNPLKNKYRHHLSILGLLPSDLSSTYFKLIQYPCKFGKVYLEFENRLFKFKFLQLLENQLLKDDNGKDNYYKEFIEPTTSNEVKMNLLKKLYEIIKNDPKIRNIYRDVNSSCCDSSSNHDKLLEITFQKKEYQKLFKNLFKQIKKQEKEELKKQQKQSSSNYNEIENNIFLTAFNNGDIKLCELILSYYSNYQFKLTKESIRNTINNNNIHIINHFLKYHNNMFKNSNIDLINHLNNELNHHKNYKYIKINKQ